VEASNDFESEGSALASADCRLCSAAKFIRRRSSVELVGIVPAQHAV
jgi:hypothetical protein